MADFSKTITLRQEVNIPTPRIPDPPTSFHGVEDSPDIDLDWIDNDTVAAFYDIEHSIDNFANIANTHTMAAAPESGSIYSFSGLNLAITNYFRIKSRNATGSSAWVSITVT